LKKQTSSTHGFGTATRLAAVIGVAVLIPVACGADDDGGGDSGTAGGEAAAVTVDLAERARAEFVERGEGVFFDTGFSSYCRAGSGFADGVLAELGYTDENAPDGYELCYNVNDDLTAVALGVTSMRTGETTCVRLDASSGVPVAGEPEIVDRCGP
jgi:hypothetical protein